MNKLLALILLISVAHLGSAQRRGSGWRHFDWGNSDSSDSYSRRPDTDSTSQQRSYERGGWSTKDADSATPRRIHIADSSSQRHFDNEGWTVSGMDTSARRRINQADSANHRQSGTNGWTATGRGMDSSASRYMKQEDRSSQSHIGNDGWTPVGRMGNSAPRRIQEEDTSSQHRFGRTMMNSNSAAEHHMNMGSTTEGRYSIIPIGKKDMSSTSESGRLPGSGIGTSGTSGAFGTSTTPDWSSASQQRMAQRRGNQRTLTWQETGRITSTNSMPADTHSSRQNGYGESSVHRDDFNLYGKQHRYSSDSAPHVDRYGRNRY